jgi:hypothetical protein
MAMSPDAEIATQSAYVRLKPGIGSLRLLLPSADYLRSASDYSAESAPLQPFG